MFKDKFKELTLMSNVNDVDFEIISESQAASLIGGCGILETCESFTGSCTSLRSCNRFLKKPAIYFS
jgi:hypothetical protein